MNPRNEPPTLCPLDAYRLALDLIQQIAPKMKKLDGDSRRQLRKALNSIVQNIAEGWGRRGDDRQYHFRVAYSSCLEAGAAIDAARAWGQIGEVHEERILVGRILATLRPLAGWGR